MKKTLLFGLILALMFVSSLAHAECAGTEVEAVSDGSFEASASGGPWAASSTNYGTPVCDVENCGNAGGAAAAHTGNLWAWFGGAVISDETPNVQNPEVGTLSQTIDIGEGSTLSFWLKALYGETFTAADNLVVTFDGDTVFSITIGEASAYAADYVEVTVDLSTYAAGTHTLLFTSTQDTSTAATSFLVDDLSVKYCEEGG